MSENLREALKQIVGVPEGMVDTAYRMRLIAKNALAEQPAQGEAVAPADVQRVIDRLMSSDPNFDDCEDAANMLRRLAFAPPAPAVPDELTPKQIVSACFSLRHDYGLLPERERDLLAYQCREWWRAISKELNEPSQHPMVLAAAPEVKP